MASDCFSSVENDDLSRRVAAIVIRAVVVFVAGDHARRLWNRTAA